MPKYKRYLNIDVVTAARDRVRHIYDAFDSVAVCFSGGKDSLVALAKATGVPQPRLHAFLSGAQPTLHLDHVQAICEYFGMRLTKPARNLRRGEDGPRESDPTSGTDAANPGSESQGAEMHS
jgi:hypothetical protein